MVDENKIPGVVPVDRLTPDHVDWTEVNRAIDGFLLQASEKDVDLIIKRLQLWLDYRKRTQ